MDNLDITIEQRLCEALYTAGRTKDPGESFLKMANTLDEERYMSGPLIKWIIGEFMFNQFGCRAFETSPQISPTYISPLPKVPVTVTEPRIQSSTMKRRQPPIHGLPHRY